MMIDMDVFVMVLVPMTDKTLGGTPLMQIHSLIAADGS